MAGTDYTKKKNAELEELLKARSLPHTGKKAELIARLQEYDAKQASLAKPSTTTTGDEDQIDWDDDEPAAPAPTTTASTPKVASNPPATAALAAGGQGQVANPAKVPNQVVDTDPSKTDDLTVDPPAPPSDTATKEGIAEKKEEAPPTDFTSGLQGSNVDDEIAKRKRRLERFGVQEDNDNALKALERTKRFGEGSAGDPGSVRGLDEALPERGVKERGVKRGREEAKDVRPASKRRESGKRDQPARNGRSGSRKGRGGGKLSEKDQLAAEARRKRFEQAV